MDFQTLNRRELQALCKLNKIPANVTNIAMVDALKSLETVEGIEEFLNPSRSETIGSSIESPERIQATSVRVPRTTCRTSTRQKANNSETESLHATASRATSRGVRRQLDGEVNEFLKTPMVSSIRKKGTTTSTHQETLKKETATTTTTTVQKAYSTRRSTRLTAKKSEGIEVIERERSEPIKLDSFLDEVKDLGNQSDENSKNEKEVVHVDITTLESGEKKVDCCGEVDDLKVKSDEIIEQHENVDLEDLKPDSEPCEDDDSEEKWVIIDEKIDLNEALNVSVKEQDANFMVPEEHTVKADDIDDNALSFNTKNPSDPSILKPESIPCVVSEMKNEESEYNGNLIHFNSEIPNEPLKLDNHIIDEVMIAEGIDENISENKVDFEETQESLMEEIDVDEVTHESFMKEDKKSSDNKENEENINEKEGDGDENVKKNLIDTSLRQLKKQLKALTIKSKDASCVTTTEMEN
ncbi:hypothetical protein Lser_V15G11028 [Lactuca serriola]